MASLTFTDVAEVSSKGRVGGSFLVQVSGGVNANAVVYSGIVNEDVDGAPRCYGVFPFDAGLDQLKNATNNGNAQFDPLPAGQVAHPWVWRSTTNMTHKDADDAGILDRLHERPELAGRDRDRRTPERREAIPAEIPGEARRRPQFLRLHHRPGEEREPAGDRSGALVGRDRRQLRRADAAVARARRRAWRFRRRDPPRQRHQPRVLLRRCRLWPEDRRDVDDAVPRTLPWQQPGRVPHLVHRLSRIADPADHQRPPRRPCGGCWATSPTRRTSAP